MGLPCARAASFVLVLGLSFASAGCAVEWTREHALYCRMDETLAVRETLSFDRAAIDDAAWRRFETDAIASAFPDAFTVTDARDHRIVAIVHADDAASDAAAREIVKRFHADFPRSTVRRERTTVCASR